MATTTIPAATPAATTAAQPSPGAQAAGTFGFYSSVAGAFMQAYGAYAAVEEQKAQLRASAELDAINARMAEQAAASATEAGTQTESMSKMRTAHLKSSQRTAMAAGGVDLGVGSAARVLTSTDVMGEVEANNIRMNALQQAWGIRTGATNSMAQAGIKQANAGAMSGGASAAASLLSSAGTVAKSWYMYKNGV